jgi:hypothetical protein
VDFSAFNITETPADTANAPPALSRVNHRSFHLEKTYSAESIDREENPLTASECCNSVFVSLTSIDDESQTSKWGTTSKCEPVDCALRKENAADLSKLQVVKD